MANLALPIGISFYMFQMISYVIDIYRGTTEVQRSFSKLLLYVSLFPQLIAGPIVRYGDIAEKLVSRSTDINMMRIGIERFIIGLSKKAVLANNCGIVADAILDPTGLKSLSPAGAWLGFLFFALQIYFDFSAYSDMAIGMGRMLGFQYRENFNYPYISKSASEFWRRWHISLGTFFRDYVYIPMGGNRKRVYLNLLIVWALTGLWHGANWNFVLWGLYWFVLIAIEKLFLRRILDAVPAFIAHLYLIVVMLFGWVLFYYENISDAVSVYKKMFDGGSFGWTDPITDILLLNNLFLLLLSVLACLPLLPAIKSVYNRIEKRGGPVANIAALGKYLLLIALLVLCTVMLAGNSFNPFIYFRF
ncbi:MAG: MBOAT family protein [Clostridiales Family XIII bacterium]|nr:MBOAT family protein [Clostridiales Family XIII bacterium]